MHYTILWYHTCAKLIKNIALGYYICNIYVIEVVEREKEVEQISTSVAMDGGRSSTPTIGGREQKDKERTSICSFSVVDGNGGVDRNKQRGERARSPSLIRFVVERKAGVGWSRNATATADNEPFSRCRRRGWV